MKTLSTYRIRRIASALKAGKAWIEGKTCDGHAWPEGRHYWIVQMPFSRSGECCITYHVPVKSRPSWGRYQMEA